MFGRLGDRVQRWITHNEPIVTAMMGHRVGVLAPGIRDLAITARVVHHLHLSHGLAVQAFRASDCEGEIGITNANTSYEPADDSADSARAVELARDFNTRLFHDPVYGRGYPESVLRYYEANGAPFPVEAKDLEIAAAPTDFLGVNLYSRQVVRADSERGVGYRAVEPTLPLTDMGYEAAPHALGDFIRFVSQEYDRPRIYVTENGVCDPTPPKDGVVDDRFRVELLRGFLEGLAGAIDDVGRLRDAGADSQGERVLLRRRDPPKRVRALVSAADPERDIHESVWLAPGVQIYGAVAIAEGCSVWPNAVIRAECNDVAIGRMTNIQDFAMIHVGFDHPTRIGEFCSITHHATVHGASVGDHCLVGISATLMDGAVIGPGSIVAGGAFVTEGSEFPESSIIAGVPAKLIKQRDSARENRLNAWVYHRNAQFYRRGAHRAWDGPEYDAWLAQKRAEVANDDLR
jgi:carbonic anhydrase/acetyltransferase-like protein (isoleucine patch superfamily)